MSVLIRLMNINDYDGMLALWKSLPGMGLSSADEKNNIQKFLAINPESCFVATDGEKIISTALCGNDGRRGYIYHLAVDPSYQKMGLGRNLASHCLTALRKQGIRKCHIFVIRDNRIGIYFWKQSGWQIREDIILMSKDI